MAHTHAGVECITFDREADQELVSLLRERPGGYAIMGNDSDFFVMDGARYIPFEYVHVNHLPGESDGDLCVRVFTPEVSGSVRCPLALSGSLARMHSSSVESLPVSSPMSVLFPQEIF